jgi:acyl-CoA synthetase (NDP forming)
VSTRIEEKQDEALSAWERRAIEQVDALLNPRNVVIVGASDRKASWTEKVYENLKRYKFAGAVYPINPKRSEIWGVPCYASLAALPEKPDHLAVLVPAPAVVGVLREGAAAGARSATIFTSGFEESDGPEGAALAHDLQRAVQDTGIAVSGPNCFGNLASSSSLVTIPDGRAQSVAPGPVAIIAQSGGIGMAIKRTLEERGARVGYVVTSGNETGLTTADYVRYFVSAPDVKVIVCYLEAVRDRDGFLAACRAARAVDKPVIVVKLGTSVQGRAAALAHTGALAGTAASFDAIAGVSGAVRVTNLDDLVEVTEYALHARLPKGRGVAAITFSGGLRGMLLDAAERNGVHFAALQETTREAMKVLLGVGSGVGNPVDGGFAAVSSQETYLKCVELMLNDPGVDLLLLQEELPRGPGAEAKESNLRKIEELATMVAKPIAYTSMISYGLNDYSRALRADLPHLPFLQEVDKSLRAVARIVHYATSDMPAIAASASEGTREVATKLGELARGMDKASALSEPVSKEVLRAYGVPVLAEQIVRTADEAAGVAEEMGFPVVMKAVSADLPHKTEAGAVKLGLASRSDVKAAYSQIIANVKAYNPKARLEGVIVSPQISGGLELVLGISRDPEVGAVVMFGLGGIGVDLHGDVAFSHPMLDEAEANKLIDRTKAAKLIDGYRGQRGYDRAAVARALVALGALARDLGDVIEAVDVNPFVALPEGGYALDGLVVVRPHAENSK